MKRCLSLAALFLCVFAPLFSQVSQEIVDSAEDLSMDALLALSSPDYRVTAGDVYTLAYAAGTTPVTFRIIVDSSYRVPIANLGVVNAAGKTYRQFKREAEAIVANNYPLSGAQLALIQPGYFQVYLAGEVNVAAVKTAWALSRLSSLLEGSLTGYSSTRDITVTSASGQSAVYDLFLAQRDGDLSQDPYLRPEDVVRINRIDRVVTIDGAVERPGSYQLLSGEHLRDLIQRYASNLTPVADPSRMELVRYLDSKTDSGDKLYLSERSIVENYPLRHLDAVSVPAITDLTPVMFVEGAVRGPGALESAESNVANRLTVRFNQGENYASLARRHGDWFTSISDTRNAYVIRGEERIPLDLNPMLYDSNYRSQYFVERNDVLIVPFRQYFVTVAGAVAQPDRYPYIPDRSWEYYVALAGGFVKELNSREAVEIKDLGGKRMRKTDAITPETTITARTNAGLYYFNRIAPVVTTVLSIITTFVSVTLLVTR
ncbi:MAG: SLBB domain-containing protein [Treponema sp.]|nr:SLBB domain-containing protein [Treponema sp.]